MKRYLLLPILLLLVYAPMAHAQSLDIPVKGYGISFGNSKNFTGLRFNYMDKDIEEINGINFSFVHDIKGSGSYNGITLGFGVGSTAGELNGIGLGAATGFKKVRGIAIGGWYGSFSIYDEESDDNLSEATLIGIQMGFIGTGTRKGKGFSAGGLFNLSDEFNGIAVGGLFNVASKEMNGLQIGIFNATKELNGIQIGLINYAGNNSPGLQWLPLINAHFSF